jgi:hypothetical protein
VNLSLKVGILEPEKATNREFLARDVFIAFGSQDHGIVEEVAPIKTKLKKLNSMVRVR